MLMRHPLPKSTSSCATKTGRSRKQVTTALLFRRIIVIAICLPLVALAYPPPQTPSSPGCAECATTGRCSRAYHDGPGQYCGTFQTGNLERPCCCPTNTECRVTAYDCKCHVSHGRNEDPLSGRGGSSGGGAHQYDSRPHHVGTYPSGGGGGGDNDTFFRGPSKPMSAAMIGLLILAVGATACCCCVPAIDAALKERAAKKRESSWAPPAAQPTAPPLPTGGTQPDYGSMAPVPFPVPEYEK